MGISRERPVCTHCLLLRAIVITVVEAVSEKRESSWFLEMPMAILVSVLYQQFTLHYMI